MELNEMQTIWKQYDKKISENTRLNKEILKRMLIQKPEKRVNWIKIKAKVAVYSPVLFLLLPFIDVKFRLTINFYIGVFLFISLFAISYLWNVKYFLLIRKIDFSQAVVTLKKNIAALEKYKIKTTRIRYMLMPFGILGIFLMLIKRPVFNIHSYIMFGLIIVVFLSSMYFTFKYSIYEQFRKLNNEIDEIAELEKD